MMTMGRITALFVMVIGIAPGMAAAGQRCSFGWQAYEEGAVSCQAGRQFRCADGAWQSMGTDCADEDPADSSAPVRPGVNEPTVRDPSVKQPAQPQVDRVPQPTAP